MLSCDHTNTISITCDPLTVSRPGLPISVKCKTMGELVKHFFHNKIDQFIGRLLIIQLYRETVDCKTLFTMYQLSLILHIVMITSWHWSTVYPKKYAHGFVVLCFVVVMQSFVMNSHEVFIHIHQGCFAGTGAIVRLPQCQWSKPDGYGKISQRITTTKHSKAKTVCIFLWICCTSTYLPLDKMTAISPTIVSDAFSWMKRFVFWLKFHWSLFLRV